MFRHFATLVNDPKELFNAHPFELVWLLEEVWRNPENNDPNKPLGHPDRRSNLQAMASYNDEWPPLSGGLGRIIITTAGGDETLRRFRWDHLIYAYMIENTRVYEIFRRAVYEFMHGEKIGTPTDQSQQWLRNTEELFSRTARRFSSARSTATSVRTCRRTVATHTIACSGWSSTTVAPTASRIPTCAPTRRTTNSSPRSRSSCAKSGSE